MKVLVTGGAGYIGSTICSCLMDRGHTPVILDSLINGREEFTKGRFFYKGDIGDNALLDKIFRENPEIEHTVHCAALASVPDSVKRPFEYYSENVSKTNSMLKRLCGLGRKNIIFSSSASVYGGTDKTVVTEEDALDPQSPYAATKAIGEAIMKDFAAAYKMKCLSFRYFNVIGADSLMRTGPYGEDPSSLLPKLIRCDKGLDSFKITGADWPTRDGTGLRDYIHVWDLALAHVTALEKFNILFGGPGFKAINLGSGKGVTVREFISDFEAVTDRKLHIGEAAPRPGDVAGAYTSIEKAKKELEWQPSLTVKDAIEDSIKWFKI